ncbi:MAG: DUF1569 domain-containing protein [Phycisphaeraceae bacterium]|nr:DUF1569 domain-containing protein [Phycisphaeraceae bacterium]
MEAVNTAKLKVSPEGVRDLHFSSLDEVLAEADRIAAAERDGRLKQIGNWSAGQIFNHLATWIDYSYDGFPPQLSPPWFVRLIVKLQKHKFMNGAMPRGVRIPGIENGTLATESVPLEEGVRHLRASLERLKREKPTQRSVLFGEMTHEEWIKGTLRHAELHMSFLRY